MGWLAALVVVVALVVVFVWSTRGGIRQKELDDVHGQAMTSREPRPPQDGSHWGV